MKRYRLKKDLPTFKAGDEFRLEDSGLWKDKGEEVPILAYLTQVLEKFPNILTDWFEEIPEEPKTVYDLNPGDECWAVFMSEFGHVAQRIEFGKLAETLRLTGSLYLTKGEAEKDLARRKAKQILLRDTKGFKPKWGAEIQQDKYFVYFDYIDNELLVRRVDYRNYGVIHFRNYADAKASIKAHEKEWKIYLRVEE